MRGQLEVKPRPWRSQHDAGADVCRQEPRQAACSTACKAFRHRMHTLNMKPVGLIRGVEPQPTSCQVRACDAHTRRLGQVSTKSGRPKGGSTVPTSGEIGDLRRGRLPRHRCGDSSTSSHVPGDPSTTREPTYAGKNRAKLHAAQHFSCLKGEENSNIVAGAGGKAVEIDVF